MAFIALGEGLNALGMPSGLQIPLMALPGAAKMGENRERRGVLRERCGAYAA